MTERASPSPCCPAGEPGRLGTAVPGVSAPPLVPEAGRQDGTWPGPGAHSAVIQRPDLLAAWGWLRAAWSPGPTACPLPAGGDPLPCAMSLQPWGGVAAAGSLARPPRLGGLSVVSVFSPGTGRLVYWVTRKPRLK